MRHQRKFWEPWVDLVLPRTRRITTLARMCLRFDDIAWMESDERAMITYMKLRNSLPDTTSVVIGPRWFSVPSKCQSEFKVSFLPAFSVGFDTAFFIYGNILALFRVGSRRVRVPGSVRFHSYRTDL